jgi:hypothetical protein
MEQTITCDNLLKEENKLNIKSFKYNYSDLKISSESLSLAMGYPSGEISDQVKEEIGFVMSMGKDICNIEGGYLINESISFDKESYSTEINDEIFNLKKIVFNQLKKSEALAVFVCTAGYKISQLSKYYMNQGDLLRGYVHDIFGSIVVEAAMDLIQNELKIAMHLAEQKITNRYSPGYCNWDVFEQKKLFKILPDNFCGITLTDSCLMQPIKSVSGVIGIGKKVIYNQYTCNLCGMQNCLYRNLHKAE